MFPVNLSFSYASCLNEWDMVQSAAQTLLLHTCNSFIFSVSNLLNILKILWDRQSFPIFSPQFLIVCLSIRLMSSVFYLVSVCILFPVPSSPLSSKGYFKNSGLLGSYLKWLIITFKIKLKLPSSFQDLQGISTCHNLNFKCTRQFLWILSCTLCSYSLSQLEVLFQNTTLICWTHRHLWIFFIGLVWDV